MAIHTDILAFLRDAQYRVAELTSEINEGLEIGEIQSPKSKHRLRLELSMFIEVLYEINWGFTNGYNLILTNEDPVVYMTGWNLNLLNHEMQYLRNKAGMVNMPLISFGPYWTDVVNISTGQNNPPINGGLNVIGVYKQFPMFNISNQLVAVDVDEYAGMLLNETITDYFSGRV